MSDAPRDARSMDRLMDETRIIGASRMIPEGTEAEAVTKEIAHQVILNVKEYEDRTKRSYKQIARDIGISPSTLSGVLSASYAGDWRKIIIHLDRWLDEERKRDSAPKTTQYVRTQVALEIETVADLVVGGKTIGLLIGDSGVGKSLALRAVAATKPGSIMITASTAHNTPVSVLMLIARELKLPTAHHRTEQDLFDRVRDVLVGTSRLLIVDEAHAFLERTNPRAFSTLRYLYDATADDEGKGSPQLWSSTVDLIAKFRKGEGAGRQPLEQIRSRIGIRHDLMERADGPDGGGEGEPLYTIEEIRQVFAKCKMRLAPDAARYLMLLCNIPKSGHLRACKVLMDLTVRANQAKAQVITAEMLKAMMRYTEFRGEYKVLQTKLESRGAPRLAAKVG